MSGQFPGGYQSPSGHRGNYNSPIIQQHLNQMNVPNQMGMMGFNQNNVMNSPQMQGVPGQGNQDMGLNPGMMQQNAQQQQQAAQGMQTNPQQVPSNQHQQGQNQMVGQNASHQASQPTAQMGMQPGGNVGPGNVMNNPQSQNQSVPPNQPGGGGGGGGGTTVQQQQKAEFNLLSLCRIGQETVQDIVSRFQEVFGILRSIQPPNGTNQGQLSSNDKKAKVQEQFRTIRLLFKRLRLLYDKCNDNCQQGMEYTHVESLIPLKGEIERTEPVHTEEYKKALQENRELVAMVQLKNKQLREIIDKIRLTIWEINTMLSMRRC
ncbi:mediator of RNA polymerase II transcription subunit 30 [Anopheles maculipalpis]|uniref:mediator of RNA polymerase II transcription subunit 30 n=1 Tax=Anopheles maculipalpis TaxID=1496333 RepID=UPI002159135C|nr:mediator of RNA polymerase II transcription subunit 30 [Anopheles maculipalpis]